MTLAAFLLALFNMCKTISPVILAVLSGLVMVLTKTLGWGISELFQILAVIFSGASVVGLRIAMAELSALAQAIQGSTPGAGTTPAANTGTGQEAKAS